MKTILSVLKSLQHSPLKSFLTLFTVGLGVGVLIFAISISETFSRRIEGELSKKGMIVTLANAEFTEENGLDIVRPPQLDDKAVSILSKEISGVGNVTPISRPFWNEFIVGTKTYRIRNQVAVNEFYDDITGMEMAAGFFFSAEDVAKGTKNAVISETLAKMLFGSADEALGKQIRPPAGEHFTRSNNTSGAGTTGNNSGNRNQQGGGDNVRVRFSPPTYTISGVFKDFSELKRKAYGLGDLIVPLTSIFPAEMNNQMARRFLSTTMIMNVTGVTLAQVESQARSVLGREYGDDLKLHVWEGSLDGESAVLDETRQSLSTFALVVNLLGFLLLITGSIGILSIMLVEVLGRSRDISLERSLGASKSVIIKEYFIRAVVMTFASVAIGIVLSFIFSGPIKEIVLPIFNGLSESMTDGGIITPLAILISAGSAMLIGGIFGVLPVFSALNTVIADGLREV